MSEPKRYTGKTEGSLLGSPHWEHPEGEWIKWEENARLKAEVDRLTKENANNCDVKEYWFLECKSARKGEAEYLKDIERLTEAGNHLWAFAHNCVVLGVYPKTAQEKINIWNAAKRDALTPVSDSNTPPTAV